MENLYELYIVLLGSGVVCLMLRYVYSRAFRKKSIFQKPENYVVIRTWRKR
mgnify:CR=1 FL=1